MTLQKRDILQYGDLPVQISINILQPYFKEFPERLVHSRGFITSLRRGYFASYEIKNQRLYIVSLKRYVDFDRAKGEFVEESTLDIAFPDTKKCTFFSGWIEISSYPEIFEDGKIKLIEIKNGDFVREFLLSEDEFKTFQQTKAYKEFYQKHSFMWY